MRSILKALIIVIVGTVAFGLCLVYFGGIIEQVIEILPGIDICSEPCILISQL